MTVLKQQTVNLGAAQIVQMHRLICTFIVCICIKQNFHMMLFYGRNLLNLFPPISNLEHLLLIYTEEPVLQM